MKIIDKIALVLIIIGAINWGLIAIIIWKHDNCIKDCLWFSRTIWTLGY